MDRFFAKFGSLRFLPRLESIAISRTRIWMQLGVYMVARREKVGGGGELVKQFAVRPAFFLEPRL